jgi:type IV secretory pathway VirB9-like protein
MSRIVCLVMLALVSVIGCASAQTPDVARTVYLAPDHIVTLHTKVRYTTLITLPPDEEIVYATCGDPEFWIVNVHPDAKTLSIKPAKVQGRTNLNLRLASGQVYTFVLEEVSKDADREPDLAVRLARDPLAMMGLAERESRFVPATLLTDAQQELETLRADLQKAKDGAQQQIDAALARDRATYPASLRFAYRYKPSHGAFRVRAMFHDDRFTYIQCDGELPAIYEIRDGAPALVDFDVNGRTYIVSKVLDRGYLAIGRERLPFVREAR